MKEGMVTYPSAIYFSSGLGFLSTSSYCTILQRFALLLLSLRNCYQAYSNMTSQSFAATKRIANRRTRQARSRARRLAQMKRTTSEDIRAPKRRKLRDQESLNLAECYFQCEEKGYHLDPDVHIGSAIPHIGLSCASHTLFVVQLTTFSENPFSALDPDTTDSYEAKSSTASDYNSCTERPETPYYQYSCASSAISSEKTSPKFEDAPSTGANIDYMAPGLPVIPFTPEPGPFVRMAGSFSSPSDNDGHSLSNFYLDNIRIPSPLLYHKSEGRSNFEKDKDDISELSNFELVHGQSKPEPDFVTYRNIALEDVTVSAQNSQDANDTTLIATKQASLGFRSPQPGDNRENVADVVIEKTEQLGTGPNHSVQEAHEGHICRILDESDILDMPGGFTWNPSQEEIRKNRWPRSPNLKIESKDLGGESNLIFPELSLSPNDRSMDVVRWNNNIALPWNRNFASSSPSWLDKEFISVAPPSPCRDLVLAVPYPRTLTALAGKPWTCNGTSKLPALEHYDEEERTVQRTQMLKPFVFPGQPSRLQGTKEHSANLDETSEKPEIRSDDLLTLPKSPNYVRAPGSLIFDTGEDDGGYFTPSQMDSDAEVVDHSESETDCSDWEWDFDSIEEDAETANCES